MASNIAQVVATLLDSANDEDESVEESVRQALCAIGSARPAAVLKASLTYLQASAKIAPRHRVQILKAIQGVIEVAHSRLDVGQTGRLATFACEELFNSTKTKRVVYEWETTSCNILVALTRAHPTVVMDDLSGRVSSGEVPHPGIVLALKLVAHENAPAFVPYFSKVISRLLPMFGAMENSELQSRVAQALHSFCDAVLQEEAVAGGAEAAGFASRSATVGSALNALGGNWMIRSRDANVRGSSAEAIGCMSKMVDDDQLDGSLAFILGHMVSLLRRERADSDARLGLVKGLEMLLTRAQRMAEPHLTELLEMLHPLACNPVDYSIPATIRVQAEILRCLEALTKTFPTRVTQFLLKTFEDPRPALKVGTCLVLKHLVNAAYDAIAEAGMREHIISGALKLTQEESFELRGAFAQMIVAMGKAGFLTMGGGRELVLFVVNQCAITDGEIASWEKKQKGWFSSNVPKTSPKQLRNGCERFVEALGQCAEDSVWPLLLTTITPMQYDSSLTPVAACLSKIALKKSKSSGLGELKRNSDVPKSSVLFSRLLVLSCSIAAREELLYNGDCSTQEVARFKAKGWSALDLLVALAPMFPKEVGDAWKKGNVLTTLETTFSREGNESDSESADVALSLDHDSGKSIFSGPLNPIEVLLGSFSSVEASWLADVGDSLVSQLEAGAYSGQAILKAAVFAALGMITSCLLHGERPRRWLTSMMAAVDHYNHVERYGLAVGVGLAAGKLGSHVDTVLQCVAGVIRDETAVKSSGWFGGVDEKSVQKADSTKGTMLLCLGSVALYTPVEHLQSRLEAHIINHINATVDNLAIAKRNLRECVAHSLVNVGDALQKKANKSLQLSVRDDMLILMSKWVDDCISAKKLADQEALRDGCVLALRACANMISIHPAPSMETIESVLQNILPLIELSSTNDEEDVVNPVGEVLRACVKVYPNQAMLNEIIFSEYSKSLESEDKGRIDQWVSSISGYQRLRAIRLIQETLEEYIERVKSIQKDKSFPFEKVISAILPRAIDSEKDVRLPAINAIDLITSCKSGIGRESSIFVGTLKVEQQKRRLENAGPGERLVAFRSLAQKCIELFDPSKLEAEPLIIENLVVALNDEDDSAACAASEALLCLFHHHGKDIGGTVQMLIVGDNTQEEDTVAPTEDESAKDKADSGQNDGPVVGCLIEALDCMKSERDHVKDTALAAVRSLASFHFKDFVNALLSTPVPLNEAVTAVLVALASGGNGRRGDPSSAKKEMLSDLAELLTTTLNDVPPGSEGEPNSVMLATHYAIDALMSAPGQNITTFIDFHFCTLSCTLLLSVGSVHCSIGKESIANESVVDALQQLFSRASVDRLVTAMSTLKDEYDEDSSLQARLVGGDYDEAIGEVLEILCKNRFDYQQQIFTTVEKFLSGPNAGQRIAATAMCSILVKSVASIVNTAGHAKDKDGALDMLKKLTKLLLSRATDSEDMSRKHALRGVGYLATCRDMSPLLPAMSTILNVLNNGIDDANCEVKNEALGSLKELIRVLPKDQTVSMVMNICFRLQSVFSCDNERTRSLSFDTLRLLCTFTGSTGGNLEEQCSTILPVLLMHLNTSFDVSSSTLLCLSDLIPLLGESSSVLENVLNKHTNAGHRGSSIDDYDPFLDEFIGAALKLYPGRAEAWVSKSKQLVSAEFEWPGVRGSAATVLGKFMAYLDPSVKSRVNVGGICTALTALLGNEDAGVRSRGALSLALLKNL
jgi:hypothetical protein